MSYTFSVLRWVRDPVTSGMMEKQANVGPLRPSCGHDAPICVKAKCKLWRQG
jgi:hypothetical protein